MGKPGKIVKREDFTDDMARQLLKEFPNMATRKNPWIDDRGLDEKPKRGRKPKQEEEKS